MVGTDHRLCLATVNQGRWRLLVSAYDESGMGEEAQLE